MENTIENKAKFFALYWGQQVLCWKSDTSSHKHKIVGGHSIANMVKNTHNLNEYLGLKSLSQISDEDAIEVAKLHGFVSFEGVEINSNGYYVLQPRGRKSFIFFVDMWLPETDYLRSKGYALPWKGITVEKMIEYNWIKLK